MFPPNATMLQMMKLRPHELDRLNEKHPELVAEARIRQTLQQQSGDASASAAKGSTRLDTNSAAGNPPDTQH